MIWAMDFQFDTTADGRTVKMWNVIDEFTREALAIEVDRSIDGDGVVDVLDRLVLQHGAPHYVRFDNGPEFVAHAVSDWCRINRAGSLFIDPGSPWQNAWIESFNGRLRDELLNSWRFDSLLEARVIIEDWRCDYNASRPHSAHGELTPAEFALQWTTTQPKPHSDYQMGPPPGAGKTTLMSLLIGSTRSTPVDTRITAREAMDSRMLHIYVAVGVSMV
ncbi:putative transposase [Mycobacterium sp. URHB0021]